MAESIVGIQSFGAWLPRRRMQRGAIAAAHAWAFPSLKGLAKGERTLCSWDEDTITMAVEAGRDALRGASPAGVKSLSLASTTAPYADLQNAVVIGTALRLGRDFSGADVGGSTRAGLTALVQACRSDVSGGRLVVASERRTAKPASAQEMQYGSGAAAVLVGEGNGVIAKFLGNESVSVPFFDHFRRAGSDFDYGWEERWIRDEGIAKIVPRAVTSLLQRIGVAPDRVAYFGLSGGPASSDKAVAKTLSIAPERILPDLAATVGDTGAAHSLLQLAGALEKAKPGDVIVVATFAQGVEVVAFEMLAAAPATGRRGLSGALATRIEETSYMKLLSYDGHVDLEWGMRSETDNKTAMTQLYRSADQIMGFVGGKCSSCSAIQFPRMPACVNCGAVDSQQPHALADEPAKVATYTADWLMYTPSPPLYVGLVQFDCGARVLMEMVDVGPKGLDVGTPLSMTFRIKEKDRLRGWDRYFWKATPSG